MRFIEYYYIILSVLLFKIGYITNPNCTFCQVSRETINHFLFECTFSKSFWSTVTVYILNRLGSCGCLSLRDVIIGILKEGMDLVNYIIFLGKTYLWTCKRKGIKPNFDHFKQILEIKYETEKYIAFKTNQINVFNKKWKAFEENV